ncbi:MAG: hypothetical protein K0V04_45070 [Deltaproteobacteria bacterium]|nr:hypothetical protein [Deltaproteobacteria bacterium]
MALAFGWYRGAVIFAASTFWWAPGCGTAGSGDGGASGSATGSDNGNGNGNGDGATETTSPAATGVPGLCESGDDGWISETSGATGSGGGTGGAEDDGFGMDDDMPLLTSVYDINRDNYDTGQRVEVIDVVVTTPVYPSETGAQLEFFVQEQDSGPLSGIRVRTEANLPQTPVQGDVVSIVGQLRGQSGQQAIHVSIDDPLVLTGTTTVPEPIVVSTQDLDDPSSEVAIAYEGVVVRVEAVTVTNPDPCVGEFEVDASVRIDDRFLLDAMPTPADGDGFASVAGPLIYVSDNEYESMEIAPRGGDDINP